MAYQAKRKAAYTQDFELVDEKGNVVHRLLVALDPGSCIEKLNQKYIALVRTKNELSKLEGAIQNENLNGNEELGKAYETLGKASVDLIEAVFGSDDTKTILDFYNGRYTDMISEVAPFITNVVIPDLRRITQENKKEILNKYNRKQRCAILKGWKK